LCLGGRDEVGEEAPLFDRARRHATLVRDVLASARDELAAVHFADTKHAGDLRIGIVERFAQEVCGALSGQEPLQQEQRGGLERLGLLRL